MKQLSFLLIMTILASGTLIAQPKNSGTVKGKITDSTNFQNLKDATISILDKVDSSMIVYGLSKADGSFLVENVPFGTHIVLITFQGYNWIEKPFTVSAENPTYNAGSMFLKPLPNDLGVVIVRTPPIVVKKDTLEFNADQFKTKPNSTTEDLLKKLPGVEVDKDGTVKAQGETIKRITVDGKKFFGDDPKMATRNLPSDMIDKIQVIDGLSDQSAFSGFDDGNREKTINIVTKKNMRKGLFGKASVAGGGGSDDFRYNNSLSFNKFNGNQQISFIGQANNINNQNFSIQDILGVMSSSGGGRGGGGGMFTMQGGGNRGGGSSLGNFLGGTSSGIARTLAGGLNYNDVLSKSTSVNGSYFYNNMKVNNEQNSLKETFVSNDSSLFNDNIYNSLNKNQNHRLNLEFNTKIDSMNSLMIRPIFSYQDSDNSNESISRSTKGKGFSISDVTSMYNSMNTGYNFNNSILYRHRFQKRGRTISLNLTQALNNSETDATNMVFTTTRNKIDTLNQISNTSRDGFTLGANVSYTEPIGAKGQLELNYNINRNENSSDQKTFNLNKVTGKHDLAVTNLTNIFENVITSNRLGANFKEQINKDWNYNVGMAVQQAILTSDNISKATLLSNTYYNFFPTLSLQYSKNRTKNLRVNYRGSTNQPSITQLQEVIDNSNPLSIRTGNAGLNQEFRHNININFTNFDIFTFKNFLVGINGSLTNNKIANANTVNATRDSITVNNFKIAPGAQFSRPVNVNGAYNITGYINYGFPIKNPKSNLNLTTRISYVRDVNLNTIVNTPSQTAPTTKLFTSNYVFGETVRYTINYKERLDLNFFSTSTYTMARYSQQTGQNGDFFTQNFSIEPTYSTKSGWIFAADFDYIFNKGQAEGFNQSIPLMAASIAKTFLKKKQAEVKLSVFDLFNQNQSISRTVEQNYIQDTRTNVLQRYFMLTFTYNLRSFKGQTQAQNPMMQMFKGSGGMRDIKVITQ